MDQESTGDKLCKFKDSICLVSSLEKKVNQKLDINNAVVKEGCVRDCNDSLKNLSDKKLDEEKAAAKKEWELTDNLSDYSLEHDDGLVELVEKEKDILTTLQGKLIRKNHKHFRHHISGEFQYKCIECGKEFKVTGDFNKHLRVHSGEKPYECKICGKRCTQNGNLKSHMRLHSGEKPYRCNICGKRFTQNGTLTTHLRIHSGEKPYECTLCGKGFPRNEHLKLHMRIHTGEKPYVCHVCNRGFTTNGNLLRHVKVHIGEGAKRQRENVPMQLDSPEQERSFEYLSDDEGYDITEPIVEIFVKEERIEGLKEDSVSDTDD